MSTHLCCNHLKCAHSRKHTFLIRCAHILSYEYTQSIDCLLHALFTTTTQIRPHVFDIWMQVLKRVPGTRLRMLQFPAESESRLHRRAKQRGVEASRIEVSVCYCVYNWHKVLVLVWGIVVNRTDGRDCPVILGSHCPKVPASYKAES